MKKLANLKGAKALNRQEQKAINGGAAIYGECRPNPVQDHDDGNPPVGNGNGTPCSIGFCCNGQCITPEEYSHYCAL